MKLNIVPARTGLQWVKLGLRTFMQQPFALTALFFLLMAFVSMSTIVPLVGAAIALALLPLSTLVMMVAAEDASQGKRPMPTVLVSAWRAGKLQLRPMAVLGALYAGGFLLCMGISALFEGARWGWEALVAQILHATAQDGPRAFLLWGGPAQKLCAKLPKRTPEGAEHLFHPSAHPSPLSVHRGFFGSRPFSRVNDWLAAQGSAPIDWAA